MTDYNFLMESRLSPAQFQLVNELSRIAYSEGINLYLVGGAVRDMTFGQAVVRDLDFAAEGNIEKILRHLLRAKGKGKESRKPTATWGPGPVELVSSRIDKRRGTAELYFSNGVRVGIAQCRQEVATRPGRPPEIRPGMIFEDLKSRDFALNAMAISLHPNSRGLLLDPKNGAGDIERQEIRALHSRSFWDDPVRIYRLFRLGLRFGFKPEEKTERWLNLALEERLWADLPPDKQAGEIEAVLQEDNPERVLKLCQDRGILVGLDRSLTKIPYDRFRKVSALARKSPGEDLFLLNFDCLTSKLGGAQKQKLARKVFSDPKSAKIALSLEREAKKVARVLSGARCGTPSQAYKVLSQQPRPLLLFLLAYYPQSKIQTRIKNYLVKALQVRARLPESELLVLGVKPGPKFDKILERVFLDQLDGKVKSHQQVMQELRSLAGVKEPPPPPKEPATKAGRTAKPSKGAKAAKSGKAAGSAKPAKQAKAAKSSKGTELSGRAPAGRLARIAHAVNKRKKERGRS
jgi:tRNA nucleotidyltransferase (CCA-adding enzyme)